MPDKKPISSTELKKLINWERVDLHLKAVSDSIENATYVAPEIFATHGYPRIFHAVDALAAELQMQHHYTAFVEFAERIAEMDAKTLREESHEIIAAARALSSREESAEGGE